MDNYRDWNKKFKVESEINSSKETIRYFEKVNNSSFKKNIDSAKKIEELLLKKQQLIYDFENKFGITFDQAIEYVENSDNPNGDFNLKEFNEIMAIDDEINGEKFLIYQNNKSIANNKNVITEINEWIEKISENE